MAPDTGEGAALKVDSGADARPIVQRIAFEVEDHSGFGG